MINYKKIFSIILTAVMVFSCFTFVNAEDINTVTPIAIWDMSNIGSYSSNTQYIYDTNGNNPLNAYFSVTRGKFNGNENSSDTISDLGKDYFFLDGDKNEEILNTIDGAFTFSTWIKLDENFDRTVGDGTAIFRISKGANANHPVQLSLNKHKNVSNELDGGKLIFIRNFDSGAVYAEIPEIIPLNVWTNIILSYDSSSCDNLPTVIINGKNIPISQNNAVNKPSGNAKLHTAGSDTFEMGRSFGGSFLFLRGCTMSETRLYSGVMDENSAIELYDEFCEKNSNTYNVSFSNNNVDIDFSSVKEGKLDIKIDSSLLDTETLNSDNIKLTDSDGNEVTSIVTNDNGLYTLHIDFIEEGEYTLTLSKNIKGVSGEYYRVSDKKYNFSVAYNSELRDRTVNEINVLFADEAKTNEDVMNTVINDYNYILSLDISETSNFSKIINKDSVFGLLRKQSYTSIDDIKTAFAENVQLQAKKDIDDGISEFNKALSEKNLTNLKDVIFIKYQTVFKLDTAQYEILSDKDKALSNMFGKTAKTIDDVAEIFANAVSLEKLNERKAEFINGLPAQTADTLEDYLTSYSDISETDMQNADFIENKTKVLQDILDADIKSTDELKKVFYQSVLLNAMNSVKVGNRAKTEQLLTVYSDYYTAPQNFKSAGNSLKEKLYRNITDGRTYENITDLEKQIESEMKKIKNSENSGNTGGSSSGGGGSSRSDSVKSPSYSADTSVKEEEILPTPVEAKTPFTDLKDVSWALIPIETLYEKGVINGKSETEFVPNDYVTRAEFAKIVSLAFEIQTDDKNVKFSDVNSDEWCAPFVNALNKTGIISGKSDILFGKNDCLTRADMAVILKRIADYKELTVTESEQNESFTDNDSIPEYARKAVNDLKASGILNGMGDNSFVPLGYVTRAQAAKAVYAVMNLK